MIPEQFGRIVHAGAGHDAVFGEQRDTEIVEQFAGRPPAAAPVVEVHGKGLDPLELPLDPLLVMRQRHTLGHDVGNELQLVERPIGQHERVSLDRLLASWIEADVEHFRLSFNLREGLPDVGADLAEILGDAGGSGVEEDHRAVAKEEGHSAAGCGMCRQRAAGQRADQFDGQRRGPGAVGRTERGQIDAVACQHGLRAEACLAVARGRRDRRG